MRVYIKTYGCTMNQADADIIRGVVSKHFELAENIEDAEVVVVNTCGVIDHTERKIIKEIAELKRSGKRVVGAGCLARISRNKMVEMCDGVVSPDNILEIGKVISEIGKRKVVLTRKSAVDKASLSSMKKRLNENAIAIVSISEGCLGKCSYCATRIARGRLNSFSIESIVKEVENAVRSGYREIQLTSQDTGAYGMDKGHSLPELLERICKIDGEFRIRVGMMNPQHAVRILDDLINVFQSEKIYKFLHIPVQSGDDRVLGDMKRGHSVDDYRIVVEEFRRSFDDVVISTDIIVGFPTESEEAFLKSCELVKETKPDIVNITRFSPRKGTPAFRMKDIPDWVKKERSRKLTEISREIGLKNNEKFVGRKMRVLVTKRGKNKTFLSRADSYRPVIVNSSQIGEFKVVRIGKATFNYLVGFEE